VVLLTLKKSINEWVERELEEFSLHNIRDFKIIRDALLDTNRFEQHEIAVIDLPFVQRLRRIAQTGFVYLTYPSATHNRFEHTLGVTIIATKFADAIRSRENGMMLENTRHELRLAGILHDIGHGPLSHITERILYSFPRIFNEIFEEKNNNPKFNKCKLHEMFAYLIITSSCFKDFFEDNILSKPYRVNINLDRIANIIVGDMNNPSEAYISDIINGSFDADKLDYIRRDCYFTGLKMEVDIDRIMYTVSIDDMMRDGRRGLVIDISGSPFVEQVMFNKMLLYTSIYHHHKVRTLECMLCALFENAFDQDLEMNGYTFQNLTDFLSITDHDILTLEGKPPELSRYVENILHRSLLKRALVISKGTIKGPNDVSGEKTNEIPNTGYQELLELGKNPERIRILRELIAEESRMEITPYDIWLDLPDPPSFREPSQTPIQITSETVETLDNIIPINKWLTGYAETKWKGHIFCPPQKKIRKKVNEAAQKILKREFNIKFTEFATSSAKIH
jgi:HD superfamily phosphohydrolase